jgi:large subunit ribosomal protein L11
MAEQTIDALVDAGNATPGPPLGPALGPTGVNTKAVIDAINQKTKPFAGMKVPVKITVNRDTREFTITVGSPPTASLLKKELGTDKGAGDTQSIGDLGFGRILDIAKMKKDSLLSKDMKSAVKEVVGTCVSLGIVIEGKKPKEVLKAIDAGEFDDYISGKKEASRERKVFERIIKKKVEEEAAPAEAPAPVGKEEKKPAEEKGKPKEKAPESKEKPKGKK